MHQWYRHTIMPVKQQKHFWYECVTLSSLCLCSGEDILIFPGLKLRGSMNTFLITDGWFSWTWSRQRNIRSNKTLKCPDVNIVSNVLREWQVIHWKYTATLLHAALPISRISNSSSSASKSLMNLTCSGVKDSSIASLSSTHPVTRSINFESIIFLSFLSLNFTRTVTMPPFSRMSTILFCIVSCKHNLKFVKSLKLLVWWSSVIHQSFSRCLTISPPFSLCQSVMHFFFTIDKESSSCMDWWG